MAVGSMSAAVNMRDASASARAVCAVMCADREGANEHARGALVVRAHHSSSHTHQGENAVAIFRHATSVPFEVAAWNRFVIPPPGHHARSATIQGRRLRVRLVSEEQGIH